MKKFSLSILFGIISILSIYASSEIDFPIIDLKWAQGGLSVAGRCRCLTKDSNTSIEKEGYIPYSLQA